MPRNLFGCQHCGDPISTQTAIKNRGLCDPCAAPKPQPPADRAREDARHFSVQNGWMQ